MNRLLHSPPFHKLRGVVAHEATFDASKGGEKYGTHDSSVFPTGHSTRSNAGGNGSNVVSMGDRITTECGYQYLQERIGELDRDVSDPSFSLTFERSDGRHRDV
jgi:hypothetical protein